MLSAAVSQDTAQDNAVATAAQDDEWFAEWRSRELSRVDASGTVYLDYTGSALYAESLVRAEARRLEQTVLGNPHSEHGPSRAATNDLNCARRAILDFLRASLTNIPSSSRLTHPPLAVWSARAFHSSREVGSRFPPTTTTP